MRFVQPAVLLLGTAMYIAVIAFSYQLTRGDTVQWNLVIAGVWNLLLLAATVIAIADGVRKARARRTRQLATDVLIVKLVSIPFFILNFFILAYLFLGGAAIFFFGGPVLLVAAVIGSGLTYLAVLSTSVYAWAAIAQLRRERTISTVLTVLYSILSLVPVTDVVVGVLLFGHSRRRPRLALVGVMLSGILMLIAIGLLIIFGLLGGGGDLKNEYENDPFAIPWISLMVVGFGVIFAAGIVAVVWRSTLRTESQRAARAVDTGTEANSTDRSVAG